VAELKQTAMITPWHMNETPSPLAQNKRQDYYI